MAPPEHDWKPFLPGRPAPPGWSSWESYYLSIGLKVAIDYLNLPAGVGHQTDDNKRRAKKMATTARHWCLRWYEVTRDSGVAVPGLQGPPAIPTHAVIPAATRPKWQAKWNAHVSAHNNGALPAHGVNYLHRDIWVLNDANFTPQAPGAPVLSAPARRAANVGAPWLVGPIARAAWHSNIRQPQGQAGVPGGWFTLDPVERADIQLDCWNYQPLGGFPVDPGANAVTLTTPDVVLGCFFDRLPEFLCQLGDCFRAADFI